MRFITVTDEKFIRGTATLLHSIVLNGNLTNPRFVVLHSGLDEAHESYLKRISNDIEIVNVAALPAIPLPANNLSAKKRGRLKKFAIFTFSPGEKLCYIDSDMLCLGDLNNIKDFQHFTASIDLGRKGVECVSGYPMFNSGFMVFRSDDSFVRDLSEFARPHHFSSKADQFFLNDFMYNLHQKDVSIVHPIYNSMLSFKVRFPKVFQACEEAGIRFLHFTNIKPWELKNPRLLAKYGVRDLKNLRISLSAWREYRTWSRIEADLVGRLGRHAEA